jgi:transposase
MNRDHFWLTTEQFSKIEPHLPTDTRGKARVDDVRVISGIVHVLKSGGRWIDAPADYGPRKTLYKLCPLGGQRRLGRPISRARTGWRSARASVDRQFRREGAPLGFGRKRGREKPGDRPLARRADDEDPCIDGCGVPATLFRAHGRPSCRLHGGRRASLTASALPNPARRQGLRLECDPSASRGTRRDAQHPAQSQSKMEELLLAVPLPQSQRHRTHVLQTEGFQARGDTL